MCPRPAAGAGSACCHGRRQLASGQLLAVRKLEEAVAAVPCQVHLHKGCVWRILASGIAAIAVNLSRSAWYVIRVTS